MEKKKKKKSISAALKKDKRVSFFDASHASLPQIQLRTKLDLFFSFFLNSELIFSILRDLFSAEIKSRTLLKLKSPFVCLARCGSFFFF